MRLLTSLVLLTAAATSVNAQTLLSDNFNGENAGLSQLNYSALANWTVNRGAIDLIRSGDFGLTCRSGSGSCIDMDGSNNAAGSLLTRTAFTFSAGDRMRISFWASGNQRGAGADLLGLGLQFSSATTFTSYAYNFAGTTGGSSTTQNVGTSFALSQLVSDNAPFALWQFEFIAGTAGSVRFELSNTGSDNIGTILDDVSIERFASTPSQPGVVPEPSTYALMGTGLGLLGMLTRRRRRTN